MISAALIITVIVTVLIVLACVIVHYERLSAPTRWAANGTVPRRMRIATSGAATSATNRCVLGR
ncbi:MAG: hypothetical protein ACR2QV_14320 [Gammaproteobacteria bacterium]